MNIVVDTSVIISVITNEKHKKRLIELSKGIDLIAPSSLHWEIGNAFSAMLKRSRVTIEKACQALDVYSEIPITFYDIDLNKTLKLSSKLNIYAFDAYFIECAIKYKSLLMTIDQRLGNFARKAGVGIMKVE